MKQRWYHNVDLRGTPAPGSGADRRFAQRTAFNALRNEPGLAAAVLKADMPTPLINRIAAERMAKQGSMRQEMLRKAGLSDFDDAGYRVAAETYDGRKKKKSGGGIFGKIGDIAGDVGGGIADVATGGGKKLLDGTLQGIEGVFNAIEGPIAAARADGSWSDGYLDWVGDKLTDGSITGRLLAIPTGIAAPFVIGAQGISDFGEGQVIGWTGKGMSAEQKQQMEFAGLDPDDTSDRLRFYYNNWWDGGRNVRPISEEQIGRMRELGAPDHKIEAVTEYMLSGAGYAPDGGIFELDGLSDNTQRWARKALSPDRDPIDDDLLKIARDSSALHFGAALATHQGFEPGDTGYKVMTAVGDLVGLWYVDPLAGALSASRAVRATRYGVNLSAGRSVDAATLSRVSEAISASDETTHLAQHGTGRAIHRVIDDVDRIHLLSASADPRHRYQAARLRESLRREMPDLEPFTEAALLTRSGAARRFVPLAENEAKRESARAAKNKRRFEELRPEKGDGTPAWSLRSTADEAFEARPIAAGSDLAVRSEEVRAELGEQMFSLIMREALTNGRPFYKGKMLLPGEIRMGAKLRQAGSNVFAALSGQQARLVKAWEDDIAARGVATVEDAADDALELNARTGEWREIIKGRGFGVSAMFNRAQAAMEKSFSGRVLTFSGSEGTETMRRFVVQWMPRAQAYDFMNQWARTDEAGRFLLTRNLFKSVSEKGGMRNTPVGLRMQEWLTKGFLTDADNAQAVRKLADEREAYATGSRNIVDTPEGPRAMGLIPSHMADGVRLPSYKVMRMASGRAALASKVLGLSKSHVGGERALTALTDATSAWKSGKTGTFGNMWRQTIEAGALLAILEPRMVPEVFRVRRANAVATSGERLGRQTAARAGETTRRYLAENADVAAELRKIEQMDDDAFRLMLFMQGQKAGLDVDDASLMAHLTESFVRDGKEITMLENLGGIQNFKHPSLTLSWAALPINMVREARLRIAEKTGTYRPESDFQRWVDGETISNVLDGYRKTLYGGFSGDSILQPGAGVAGRGFSPTGHPAAGINDAKRYAEAGVPFRQVTLPNRLPNSFRATDAASDVGAVRWARNLEFWMQDEVAGPVIRALVAHHHDAVKQTNKLRADWEKALHPILKNQDPGAEALRKQIRSTQRATKPKWTSDADWARARSEELARLKAQLETVASGRARELARQQPRVTGLDGFADEAGKVPASVSELAYRLIRDNATLQAKSGRLRAMDGRAIDVDDAAGREAAMRRQADDIVEESMSLLGMRREPIPWEAANDGVYYADELGAVYDRIRKGLPVRSGDLRAVPDSGRPEQVVERVFMPDLGGKSRDEVRSLLSRFATANYDLFVARPLNKLTIQPLWQAELDFAYRNLAPVADELITRGMSAETAGHFLLHNAARSATAKVFNVTDNAAEHSMFVELVDNWFMFARAMEDFFRRLGNVTSYNPGRLVRSWSLAEASATSGMLYMRPTYNDEGEERFEPFFMFPGSGVAARVMNDAMRDLGFGDWIEQPIYSGVSAPVKFFNPSLQNPIGVSANPVFGGSLRALRSFMPGHMVPEINDLIHTIEGGEDFFATQSLGKQLLPSNLTRFAEGVLPPQFAPLLAGMGVKEFHEKRASAESAALLYAATAGIVRPDMSADEVQDAIQAIRYTAWNTLAFRSLTGMLGPAVVYSDGLTTDGLPDPTEAARLNGIHSLRDEWFAILNAASNKFSADQAFGEAMTEWMRRYPKGRSIFEPTALLAGTSQIAGAAPDDLKSIPRNANMVDWVQDNYSLFENYSTVFPFLVPAVAGDRYFESTANRTLFEMGVLERKPLERLFAEVVNKGLIDEWYEMKKQYDKAKLLGGNTAQLDREWYEASNEWYRQFPKAAALKDEQSSPKWLHDVFAPEVKHLIEDEANLPEDIRRLVPDLRDMYTDYQLYREEFHSTAIKDRYLVNKKYKDRGYQRWQGAAVYGVWKKFAVTEDGLS